MTPELSYFNLEQSGLTDARDCACAPDYTGANCKLAECPSTLPLVSLGLLLIEASLPEELRPRGDRADRVLDTVAMARRVEAVLRNADTFDGDDLEGIEGGNDRLSLDEAFAALAMADVVVDPASEVAARIWSRPAVWPPPPGQVARDKLQIFGSEEITISDMVRDAVASYVETGNFYWESLEGPRAAISRMEATYPDSKAFWSEAECQRQKNQGVELDWHYALDSDTNRLYQQCAYVNGQLLEDFRDQLASGDCPMSADGTQKKCNLADGVNDIANRKRVYCIRQQRCQSAVACTAENVDAALTVTRCENGLAYDGRPADFVPVYSPLFGVRFSWLDTATGELGFRLFRSSIKSTAPYGELIADIPTPSTDCGQQFKPTLIFDRDTGEIPGTRVKYLVAAVEDNAGTISLAAPTVVTFTSPWVAILTVTIMSPSNQPVQDVEIVVEHLFPTLKDTDPNYRLDLVTNDYGSVLHNIYVTDPIRWSNLVQRLRITPTKCDGIRSSNGDCCRVVSANGDSCFEVGLEHVFEPAEQIVSIRHQVEEAVEFVDTTARSIVAYALFGESSEEADSFATLFGNDWHDPDACLEFYDKLEGTAIAPSPKWKSTSRAWPATATGRSPTPTKIRPATARRRAPRAT